METTDNTSGSPVPPALYFPIPMNPPWGGNSPSLETAMRDSPPYPPVLQQPKARHQTFLFVDQTPAITPNKPISTTNQSIPTSTNNSAFSQPSPKKRKIDLDKSRIAQQRRRDRNGQFIRKEVAERLEGIDNLFFSNNFN